MVEPPVVRAANVMVPHYAIVSVGRHLYRIICRFRAVVACGGYRDNAWRYSDRVNRVPEAAKYTRDMSAHAAATTNPARVALILDDLTASMRG